MTTGEAIYDNREGHKTTKRQQLTGQQQHHFQQCRLYDVTVNEAVVTLQ